MNISIITCSVFSPLDRVKDVPIEMGEVEHRGVPAFLTAVPVGTELVIQGFTIAAFLPAMRENL